MPRFDITAIGETMLRYSVPSGTRLSAFSQLDAHVGGAESNVLVALAGVGRRCGWFSALPANSLGRQVDRALKGAGIDTTGVVWGGERVGTYYVEFAAPPRPIQVIYDRSGSAISQLTVEQVNWAAVLDTSILHLTGITPALSSGCAEIVREACRRASEAGIRISFDVNYRAKLWSPEQAAAVLRPIIEQVDLLICGAADGERLFQLTGSVHEQLAQLSRLTDAQHIILTRGDAGAATLHDDQVVAVAATPARIVDRLGAGDAFAAGVIDGWLDGDVAAGMQRGSALGAMALTQRGDMLDVTRQEIDALLAGDSQQISR
jgi:2-dehydro-3-deoxygluconokinase